MKKILFIEYCNATPHLETSLEIAKLHIELNDQVYWYFWGHHVPYSDWLIPSNLFFPFMTPEQQGIRLIKKNNLKANFIMPKIKLCIDDFLNIKIKNIDDLIELKWNDIPIGIGVANSLLSKLCGIPDYSDMVTHHTLIKDMIKSCILSFLATSNLVQKENFDLAYIFNGRFCCQNATSIALKLFNIPVLYHERGANKNRYHIRKFVAGDKKSCQEDMMKTWQVAIESKKEEIFNIGEQFFIDSRNGLEQTWISFNANQERDKLPDIPSQKKIISYFHSSDDECFIRNKMFGNKPWEHQIEAFRVLIKCVAQYKDYHLVVRLHPHLCLKNEKEKQTWINYPIPENCTLIAPESDIDSYKLIEISKIVFTYGSTIGIESIYWGVPTVLLGDSFYDIFSSVNRVSSEKQIIDILNNGIEKPKKYEAIIYGYYIKTFGTHYHFYEPFDLFTGKFMGKEISKSGRRFIFSNIIRRFL